MVVTCRQMQQLEERAFAAGLSAARLMEDAGQGIAREIERHYPGPGTAVLYLGSGNNGGDALVAGRELALRGWRVWVRQSVTLDSLKPLPLKHWQENQDRFALVTDPAQVEQSARPLVLLDGLVGIGATGDLRPALRELAREMNGLRESLGAKTVAMDLPSGLDGDTGKPGPDAVVADLTVTVAVVKAGLLEDDAINHVGRLALAPLPGLLPFARTGERDSRAGLLTAMQVAVWRPRRAFDFHKGQAGRVALVAGSPGFLGAAVLACGGALRAGGGLVTLVVKPAAYDLLAAKVLPEVMVRCVEDYRELLAPANRWDALAVGPGLGLSARDEVLALVREAACPVVVDADALTVLGEGCQGHLGQARGARLLTPHPGEMARLWPEAGSLARREAAEAFAERIPGHVLLLKGARTVIASQGAMTWFNSTGHPGMATGGMGDVLTGVCAALAGQGMALDHAAGLAAWACGRAAELAAREQAEISVLPSDVVACLGRALAEAWLQ